MWIEHPVPSTHQQVYVKQIRFWSVEMLEGMHDFLRFFHQIG